jgi:hypothetical protein
MLSTLVSLSHILNLKAEPESVNLSQVMELEMVMVMELMLLEQSVARLLESPRTYRLLLSKSWIIKVVELLLTLLLVLIGRQRYFLVLSNLLNRLFFSIGFCKK